MIIINNYGIKEKKLANSVSSVGGMLLMLVFLACSLAIISAAANAYSKISENFGETFSSSAAVRYVTNKLRSGGNAEIFNNGKAVLIDIGSIDCIIYSENGCIYEKYVDKEEAAENALSGGELIFGNADLMLKETEDGMLYVSASSDGDNFSAYCRR